jgi:hypothetical protein
MRTGTCITLIAVGAILRFAITSSGSAHGLNVHAVGVILIFAGVLGLVLSLVVWGPLNPARRRRGQPVGYVDGLPLVEEHRVYEDQPVVVEERNVYQDQAPVVEERRVYRDQPPL